MATYPWDDHLRLVRTGTPPEKARIEQARPPLTTELFDSARAFTEFLLSSPAATGIVGPLREYVKRGDGTVEQFLETVNSSGLELDSRAILAMRGYLRCAIAAVAHGWYHLNRGVTHYRTLVHQVENWRATRDHEVCYVTFNYDDLLDRAFEDTPSVLAISDRESYAVPDNPTKLLKPHGSTTWFRKQLLEGAGVEVKPRATPAPQGFSSYEVPEIAVPVEYKPDSALLLTDYERSYLAAAGSRLCRVLIVGWRASEVHFTRLLTEGLPTEAAKDKVQFDLACGPGAEETKRNLEDLGFRVVRYIPNGTPDGCATFSEMMSQPMTNLLPL